MTEMPISPDDPCFCKSGKKFKDCHKPQFAEAMSIMKRKAEEREEYKRKYGVEAPITTTFKGYTFVAEGSRLRFSKKWATYADFLLSEIPEVLGKEWLLDQLTKPSGKQHPIVPWYEGFSTYWKKTSESGKGLISVIPNGHTSAYLQLGHELYLLKAASALPDTLLQRVRDPDHFQGARYELFVAATMVKANCTIEYEDETDSSTKHMEFVATHTATGQKVAVEAKSRHRLGVLGFEQGKPVTSETKAGVVGLIRNAAQKPTTHPAVLFVDINLPQSKEGLAEKSWFADFQESVHTVSAEINSKVDPFNMIVFTNHAEHYAGDLIPFPDVHTFGVFSTKPTVACEFPASMAAIFEAAEKYDRIPDVSLG